MRDGAAGAAAAGEPAVLSAAWGRLTESVRLCRRSWRSWAMDTLEVSRDRVPSPSPPAVDTVDASRERVPSPSSPLLSVFLASAGLESVLRLEARSARICEMEVVEVMRDRGPSAAVLTGAGGSAAAPPASSPAVAM